MGLVGAMRDLTLQFVRACARVFRSLTEKRGFFVFFFLQFSLVRSSVHHVFFLNAKAFDEMFAFNPSHIR